MEEQEQQQEDHGNHRGYQGIADYNRRFKRKDRHTQYTP